MTEASGSRPRPKPRPRPRVAVSEPKPSLPTPTEPIEILSSPSEQKHTKEADEDALFMRNRDRSAKTWKKLKEIDREASRRSVASPDTDDDDYSSPRRKNKTAHSPIMPRWVTNDGKILPLPEELDDNETLLEGEDTPKTKRVDMSPSKRKRSRSMSITPPPALRFDQVQHARDIVRQILNVPSRTPSPLPLHDDLDDTITLDPELARIAQAVRNQSSHLQPLTEPVSGGPDVVTVKVRWLPHPLDQSGQSKVWGFKMKRHDPFRVIFDEVADTVDILFDDLVIRHQHNRLFPSVTPNGLKIWADVELEACNVITDNYLRTQRHKSPSAPMRNDELTPTSNPVLSEGDYTLESDEEAGDDTFRLTLRSAANTITLKVRPTTTCGAIMKAFLKSAGLTDKYANKSQKGKSTGPRLEIDGEKLNPADPISKADLEDGDCVDVVGL